MSRKRTNVADTQPAGSAADSPLWMKLVRDEDGPKWGNILVMLAVTVASGWLASKAQRAGSNPDSNPKLLYSSYQIRAGRKIEQFGRDLQESGWALYEQARP